MSEMSRGRINAASLASAIVPRADVLLIDGLLDGLPQPLFEGVWEQLRARSLDERTTMMVSTIISGIAERADRVLLLDSGRMMAFSTPPDLLGTCARDTVTIEAADPESIRRTLRGNFDVRIEETAQGVRFEAADG